MPESNFVDFYEILESSPNAHQSTIDQLFVCQAKRFHPDVPLTGNKEKFAMITEAYQTLRDPQSRIEYDATYDDNKRQASLRISEATREPTIEVDANNRHQLLTLFYEKRRQNVAKPGMALGHLEDMVDYSSPVLEFHLWYCRAKDWLVREESGKLSITAAGIDKMEATMTLNAINAANLLLAS